MRWYENDKTVVIGGSVILGSLSLIAAVFFSEKVILAAIALVGNIITGMFGVAVGVGLERRRHPDE